MNRRRLLSNAGLGGLALLVPIPLAAHGYKTRTIDISHPWTFEQDGKGVDAIIGMDIKNKGKRPDQLLRVEAPDAVSAELRDNDAVVKSLAIASGATVTLHGKGPHILLRGVRKTLFAYNNLYITLVFARAGRIKVEVVVEDKPA